MCVCVVFKWLLNGMIELIRTQKGMVKRERVQMMLLFTFVKLLCRLRPVLSPTYDDACLLFQDPSKLLQEGCPNRLNVPKDMIDGPTRDGLMSGSTFAKVHIPRHQCSHVLSLPWEEEPKDRLLLQNRHTNHTRFISESRTSTQSPTLPHPGGFGGACRAPLACTVFKRAVPLVHLGVVGRRVHLPSLPSNQQILLAYCLTA